MAGWSLEGGPSGEGEKEGIDPKQKLVRERETWGPREVQRADKRRRQRRRDMAVTRGQFAPARRQWRKERNILDLCSVRVMLIISLEALRVYYFTTRVGMQWVCVI